MRSVMVISSTRADIDEIRTALGSRIRVAAASDIGAVFHGPETKHYDALFFDLVMLAGYDETESPQEILNAFHQRYPGTEIVVMTPVSRLRQAVDFVKAGARDYITYPVSADEIRLVADAIAHSLLRQSELDYLRDRFWKTDALDVVQTKSPAMVDVFKKIKSVAPTRTTVLLTGETGTGKSVLAKLIHQHSNRHHAQFISVHCGAIPDPLLESELFGHEKGAFTGAVRKKLGKFEIATGGTIFLDEIGTLTPSAQIKLLQVLQDGTFNRVGGEESFHTQARVIAATNADLRVLSQEGSFRKDLYYRLNVFPIEIPPLQDRIQDLPRLIDRFVDRLNREFQKNITGVDPDVIQALSHYDWPGNVRELENLIERAYILENGTLIGPDSFPLELVSQAHPAAVLPVNPRLPLADARKIAMEDFERQYLIEVLSRNKGRINLSAADAGISPRQLHKLMHRYGLRKERFK